jgi:hypothetical protein
MGEKPSPLNEDFSSNIFEKGFTSLRSSFRLRQGYGGQDGAARGVERSSEKKDL